jgi:hypothetical protein
MEESLEDMETSTEGLSDMGRIRIEGPWDKKHRKFMLSLKSKVFEIVETEAKERGITVQETIRAVIIPEWYLAKRRKMLP